MSEQENGLINLHQSRTEFLVMIWESNVENTLMDDDCISQNKGTERNLLRFVICIHPFLPM